MPICHGAAAHRFAEYQDLVTRLTVPVQARGRPAADFRATVRTTTLGAGVELSVNEVRGVGLLVRRTEALIRRCDPGAYRLLVNLGGPVDVVQNDRGGPMAPCSIGVYDTARPFQVRRAALGARSAIAMVTFPRERFLLPEPVVAGLAGVQLSGHAGVAAVFAQFVRHLARQDRHLSPADAVRLGSVLLDLAGVVLGHECDTEDAGVREARHRSLLTRIHAFIDAHLGDPDLGPDVIAAAHHISVRLLHRLFHEQGRTVAGWIKQRRLERCRRDLADPGQQARAVHVIAARWGFRSDTHFSRAFRAEFSVPPAEWRIRHRAAVL